MAEVNKHRAKEEKHCLQMQRASTDENLVKEEVAQMKALLLNQDLEWAPSQIDQVALIYYVIQRFLSQGLMMAPLASFLHLPLGFPL